MNHRTLATPPSWGETLVGYTGSASRTARCGLPNNSLQLTRLACGKLELVLPAKLP
jgi:hypothetical protein